MSSEKPYTFDRFIRLVFSLLVIGGVIWILGTLSEVLIPFCVAFLLAYLLNPFVNQIQRIISNRVVSVFLSLALVLVMVVGLSWMVFPLVMSELNHMGHLVKESVENSNYRQRIHEYIPENVFKEIQNVISQQEMKDLLHESDARNAAGKVVSKLFPKALGFLKGTANVLMSFLGLAIIALYLVFFLIDYDKVKKGWKDHLPNQWKDSLLDFLGEFDSIMSRHFRSQAIVAACVGILFSIFFGLIGLPLGILLGLLIGALNMVPYLQLLAIPPALVLAVMKAVETGQSVQEVILWVLGCFALIQIIQDAILTPRIMGKAIGLSPIAILLSVSIWGKLLGFLGLIIALPMTCLCLAYYRRYVLKQ